MAIGAKRFFKYMDEFFDYRNQVYELSAQTLKSNLVDLKLFKNFVASLPKPVINGAIVMDFQFYLKVQRNNCGASINRKIISLKSYSNFLVQKQVPYADTLPFANVVKIRNGYRKRPDALTVRQVKTIFTAIDTSTILGLRDYAVYALMYQLGLRVGEVHALNIKNLDFEKGRLEIIGKGGKPRTLPMNAELMEVLLHYLALRSRIYNSHLTPALFVSKKGHRLAIRTMEENFKKLVAQGRIDTSFNVTCHTLRHSLASHLNDKGTDILVIKSILGHSSTRSTEPYIHPSAQMVARSLEKLPVVRFVKELINKGELNLCIQKPFKPKKE